jgi:hypothetical protein
MEEVGSGAAPARSARLLWTAAVVAVVAFVLGVVGYLGAGAVSFPSAVYNTLQLFALNFVAPPGADGSYPVALEIARFVAPAVTLLAAATIAAGLFRDEFDRTTARFAFRGAGNHVIVCGLGRVGTTAVRILRADHHVIAIERDRSCPAIAAVRSLGVPVVVGDARIGRTLERAGIGRASLLIWTTRGFALGSDVATSVVTALRGDDSVGRRAARNIEDRPPACLVRVRDLGLCELLRRAVLTDRSGTDAAETPSARQTDPDIDYFNEWENTAQRLVWDLLRGYVDAPRDVDLWVVGGGPLAEALVVQSVRTWRGLDPARHHARLSIHVFDDHASVQRDRFAAAWPEAADACVLCAHDGPPELVLAHARRRDTRPANAAFVLVDGRDRALELGLRLRELESATPVAVAVPDSWEQAPDVGGGLVVFDPIAAGLDSDILFLDTYASLARMLHERYLTREGVDTTKSDAQDAEREWDDLDQVWRDSNRDAARFVVPNLMRSGLHVAVPTESATRVETFTDGETDAMAAREHERWRRFMTDRGWVYGPAKNSDAKTNPDLRPWLEVSDGARDYTRVVVGDYPRLLAQLGYEVWRVGDDAGEASAARSA